MWQKKKVNGIYLRSGGSFAEIMRIEIIISCNWIETYRARNNRYVQGINLSIIKFWNNTIKLE